MPRPVLQEILRSWLESPPQPGGLLVVNRENGDAIVLDSPEVIRHLLSHLQFGWEMQNDESVSLGVVLAGLRMILGIRPLLEMPPED